MGTKHTDSCLQKAGNDEPIFVLRSKDKFAPLIVEFWANLVEAANGGEIPKSVEAFELANKMRDWQKINGCKSPD